MKATTLSSSGWNSDRVLFISRELIAANIAYKLLEEGFDVRLFIENPDDQDAFDNLVPKSSNWQDDLNWVGVHGLIVFDDVGYGEKQDRLRREGFNVVGGSAFGDRMEQDREYGQANFRAAGIAVPAGFETLDLRVDDAIALIKKSGGRWVIKQNSHSYDLTYISEFADGSDAVDMLYSYKASPHTPTDLSIQRRIEGVEIAVGRFFCGTDWLGPIVMNREHKHLCTGNIGPLGGESGTVMWYEGDTDNRLFQNTLAKLTPLLRSARHAGYVDVNCIVDAEGHIYPLEITSRFGSSTNQLQSELNSTPWSTILLALASGRSCDYEYKSGFGVNVALTAPPYPYLNSAVGITSNGLGITFSSDLSAIDMNSIHFEEVKFDVETQKHRIAGHSGYILYVTAHGATVDDARNSAYSLVRKIHFPKMIFRDDIGSIFESREMPVLKNLGII